MRIPLNRDSPIPMYRQIHQFLREQITSGALQPSTRLPASRDLASSLGVNRITVTSAYAELEAEGLVAGRPGSGTYVASLVPVAPGPPARRTAGTDWPLWQQEMLNRAWLPSARELDRLLESTATRPDVISFASGLGASELFPVDDIRKRLHTILRRDGAGALDYGHRRGHPPLRASIAQILTAQGIPTHPEHVLITSGSQQGLSLVARLLLRPGDAVLVESPTYCGAIDLFRSLDVRLVGVPVDDQGMQAEQVEDALRRTMPRLIYTIPTFHNPTGTCMSGQRRRLLVELAGRYNVPILEDDFVGDLRYDGRAQPALKALDPGGRVIYASTFSKMLMPGLRVGFLVAEGPVYERLVDLKRVSDLATSNLMQWALEACICVGCYQAHLRRACRVYRRRRDAMVKALARFLPSGAQWVTPQGGLFLWLRLPNGLAADALYPLAAEEGVTFVPGSLFFPGGQSQPYVRLNFAGHAPEVIEEGVHRLSRAIMRATTSQGRGVTPVPRRAVVV